MNAMVHFRKLLEKLEFLGHLGVDDNIDLWALHSSYAPVISKIIDEIKENRYHHPMSHIGHKIPHSIFLTSSLNNQFIKINMDPETEQHLSE